MFHLWRIFMNTRTQYSSDIGWNHETKASWGKKLHLRIVVWFVIIFICLFLLPLRPSWIRRRRRRIFIINHSRRCWGLWLILDSECPRRPWHHCGWLTDCHCLAWWVGRSLDKWHNCQLLIAEDRWCRFEFTRRCMWQCSWRNITIKHRGCWTLITRRICHGTNNFCAQVAKHKMQCYQSTSLSRWKYIAVHDFSLSVALRSRKTCRQEQTATATHQQSASFFF